MHVKRALPALVCAGVLSISALLGACGNSSADNQANSQASASAEAADAAEAETEDLTTSDVEGEKRMATDKTVKISMADASAFNNGKFQGWGTALCWWANRVGYSDKLADEAARLFFDKNTGLGINVLRYNIGGGDDPTHDHITRTDSMIPGFAVNHTYDKETGTYTWEYDWDADKNQINVLKKAVAACGDEAVVEAFSNSAPYFMTNSGCTSGNFDAGQDNLRKDAYVPFAKYMAEVMVHLQDVEGIQIESVSAMNEPFTSYWGAFSPKQEGCHFEPGDTQSQMIIAMSDALKEYGLDNVVMTGTDETSIDLQILAYNALSDEAKARVDRIDTHTYQGEKRVELQDLALAEGKNLWMSEVDDGGTAGDHAADMGAGLWIADRIVKDMNELRPSSWVMWQVIDNHISKDGWLGRKDSGMPNTRSGYWGMAVADHDKQEIILTMKYYAFGQFSRYIRPGDTIIASGNGTLSAYNAEQNKLVIVAVNTEKAETTVDFDVTEFENLGTTAQVIRTSGKPDNGELWAELEPIDVQDGVLQVTLKGNSVTTYVIQGE